MEKQISSGIKLQDLNHKTTQRYLNKREVKMNWQKWREKWAEE